MSKVVVIGVGNRFGCDDGVGPAVIDRVQQLCPGTPAFEADGEPARLVEAWDNCELVVLVDAVRSGAPPGTCHHLVLESGDDATVLGGLRSTMSSHGAGVADAWALGTALGRTPRRLVVVGVEGACFEPGHGLSDAVARAVPVVARSVHGQVTAARPLRPDLPA